MGYAPVFCPGVVKRRGEWGSGGGLKRYPVVEEPRWEKTVMWHTPMDGEKSRCWNVASTVTASALSGGE